MAYHPSQLLVAEPYAESQGPESPTETSPEELKAFYEDMERRDTLERKLSKRKSGTSIWSRRSIRRSTTTPPSQPTAPDIPRIPSKSNVQGRDNDAGASEEEHTNHNSAARQLASSRSVIVDSREKLAWTEGAWAAVPLPTFKVNYPLHNPMGPRWYKNHHLIPPSQKRPSMRPPTFFSPSFPPMHTSSSPDHAIDDSSGPSKTPTDSPLPTPTSSQTRVADGGKARSRKTSQTAPDNVDLLDLTDPWGQNWHHQSPYDWGQTIANSSDAYEAPNRPRRASMTATQGRHMSVTPSPLSQSTSAVHLAPPQPQIQVPRKLSKRRTPTADAVFNPPPPSRPEVDKKIVSAPPTPIERISAEELNPTSLPKRMSVAPPPANSSMFQPTPKKEKRGSMLNRLAKKFSILRKSMDDRNGEDFWPHVDGQEAKGYGEYRGPPHDFGRASPEKPRPDSVKRVPPPSIEQSQPVQPPEPLPLEVKPSADRVSLASFDAPFSMGRLTIANPDLPDPDRGTSVANGPPAPPEKSQHVVRPPELPHKVEPFVAFQNRPQPSMSEIRSHLDKPLPPPQIPTPHFSILALPRIDTPKMVEQPLPPPPPVSKNPSPEPSPAKPPPAPVAHESMQPAYSSLPMHHSHTRKASGSTDINTRDLGKAETASAPPPAVNETPRRNSSRTRPTTSNADLPVTPDTAEHTRPQSPPVLNTYAAYEAPKKASPSQPRHSSSRKAVRSPEPPPKSKHERAATQPSSSSHHPHESTRDRQPEASSSHRTSKPSRGHSRSDPPAPPAPSHSHTKVPAQTISPAQAIPFPAQDESKFYAQPIYEVSPLSTSSMLANPPTPYDLRDMMLTPDQSAPPSLPPKSIYEGYEGKEGKQAAHNPPPIRTSAVNPSPTNPSPSRQTETFKLVRSSSGNVYASSQTITAAGQQWEVVESIESKGKSREQSWRLKEHEHRDMDFDRRSREQDYRLKDERKSKDYERRSKDYEYQEPEQRSREREHRSKEHEHRSERRSTEFDKVKEYEKSREYKQAKEYERSKDYQRSRDYEQHNEHTKDYERSKDQERTKDHERAKETERAKDVERSRDHERSKDYDRPKEYERPKDYERSKDHHKSRDYERPKDYERPADDSSSSRRAAKKEKESKPKPVEPVDADAYHRSSKRASKQPAQYPEESTKGRSHGKSSSRHVEEPSRHSDKKSSRKRDSERQDRKSEYRPATDTPSSSNHHVDRPYAIQIQPSDQPPARLERAPSTNTRPTSELPSAADMNAMRAKESWEMERLWKARSMYGLEPNAATTNFIPGPGSTSSISDDANTQSAVYGSSHTAYVVPTPFQGRTGAQIYHSMPMAPPPIIYSSPASIPSIPDLMSSYDPYEHSYQSYQPAPVDYRTSPPAAIIRERPGLNNPLPEPPRESPYEPKKATLRPATRHSNDYWMKYNGITTAH